MRLRVGVMALAGGAGAVDLLALAVLGGAFAGIVTGNLVTVGYGIGTGTPARITSVAVAGCYAVGVLIWSRWVRHLLLTELVVLVGVAVFLLRDAAADRPGRSASRSLDPRERSEPEPPGNHRS